MRRDDFREHDFCVVLTCPSNFCLVTELELDGGKVRSAPRVLWVPCAILRGIDLKVAMEKLRAYLMDTNPELTESDFKVTEGCGDHLMAGFPNSRRTLFITHDGYTLGPPPGLVDLDPSLTSALPHCHVL